MYVTTYSRAGKPGTVPTWLWPRDGHVYFTTKRDSLKARRIRVNVLSPGPIQTPGFDVFADKDVKSFMQSLVPFDRLGTADDVAKAALYLASDDSSYVAGIELFVDGGTAQV